MANVIKHKRGSGSDPGASDLVVGELAIRTDTGKLFTKMDSGALAEIAGGGSDIAINTLSSSSATGGGSATFNGSAYRFTLSSPPSVSAQQLLVSINGVIQKPVAGTGQPSEGFSVDGNDIILGDAPATGSDFFILTFRSLGVSVPADNSVTSAKIADGTITGSDLATNIDLVDDQKLRFGTGNDLEIYHNGSHSLIADFTGQGNIYLITNQVDIKNAGSTEHMAKFVSNGAVELYYDNSKKFETTTNGIAVTGRIEPINGVWIGSNQKYRLYDNSGVSRFDTYAYNIEFVNKGTDGSISPYLARMIPAGAVELYHNGNKKFETTSTGATFTGQIVADGLNVSGSAFFHGNVDLHDNDILRIGTGDDLQIYHDGSQSYVTNSTGNLNISSGAAITLKTNTNEEAVICNSNGSVDLYHDGSKMLETTQYGVNCTASLDVQGSTTLQNTFLSDNDKLNFGGGNDLQIYHDGSHSYIENSTGTFVIRNTHAGTVKIQGVTGEQSIVATGNGSVDLYYDNSKKFETTDTGATVETSNSSTTESNADTLIVRNTNNGASTYAGIRLEASSVSSSDFYISNKKHSAGSGCDFRIGQGTTERLRITESGKVGFNNADPSAAIEVTFDSGGSAPSSGTAPEGVAISYGTADGKNGGIWFSPGFGDDQGISGISSSRTSGYQTDLRFYTNNTNSARAFTERMRIGSDGRVMINTTSDTFDGVTGNLNIANDNFNNHTVINLSRNTTADRSQIRFSNPNGNVGSISTSGSATSYNTSSDYRLKENVTAISDGITRLKTLKPYRFNFKADATTTVDGFFAHEVTAVPEAITGTKDEVDENNNPVYQGIDQSKLVPLLVAALQEAIGRIEALEAK